MAPSSLSSRYADRFNGITLLTGPDLTTIDTARGVADNLRLSDASLKSASKGVDQLIEVASDAVAAIDRFQIESGKRQVNNIPLPTDAIKSSFGKKLGYIKLVIQFLAASNEHFMEQTLNLEMGGNNLKSILSNIAGATLDPDILGELHELELGDLQTDAPIIETKAASPVSSDDEDSDEEDQTPAPAVPPVKPSPLKQVSSVNGNRKTPRR
jgi:hypothetical protein